MWSPFPLLVQGLFTMTGYLVKRTFIPYLWLTWVREISYRKLSQGTLPLKCCRFLTLQQNDAIQRYRCCSQSIAHRLLFKSHTAKKSSPTPKGLLTMVSFSVAKHFFRRLHSSQLHGIPVLLLGHNGGQQSLSSVRAWAGHRNKCHYPHFVDKETEPKEALVPDPSIPTSKLEQDPTVQNCHALILACPHLPLIQQFQTQLQRKENRSKEKHKIQLAKNRTWG